jgi:hypothetical protein
MQYPILDKVAQKVIEKYRTTSCADLKAKKEAPKPAQSADQAQMKQKVVMMLRNDPKMREAFSEHDRGTDRQQNVRMRNGSLICRFPQHRRSRGQTSWWTPPLSVRSLDPGLVILVQDVEQGSRIVWGRLSWNDGMRCRSLRPERWSDRPWIKHLATLA